MGTYTPLDSQPCRLLQCKGDFATARVLSSFLVPNMTIQAGVVPLNYLDGRTESDPVDFERQLSGRIHSAGDSHFSDGTPVEANGEKDRLGAIGGADPRPRGRARGIDHRATKDQDVSSQAGQEVIQRSSGRYDSMILDGFAKAFGGNASGAGA